MATSSNNNSGRRIKRGVKGNPIGYSEAEVTVRRDVKGRPVSSTSRAAVLPSDYKEQERKARAKAGESTASRPNAPAKPAAKPQATPPRARPQTASRPAASPAPQATPPRARPQAPAASTPASTKTPESTSNTPAPKAGESAGMAEWRRKFPKLAEVLDKKNAARGTSKTDNPLMKDFIPGMKKREDAAAKAKEAPKPESPVGPVKDGASYAKQIETKGTGPVKDGADYASKIETKGTGPVKDGASYASSLTIDKSKTASTTNQVAQKPKTLAEIAKERKDKEKNKGK